MSKPWNTWRKVSFHIISIWFQTQVSSLDQKIVETEEKFEKTRKLSEERLKQAVDAETTIVHLKKAVHEYSLCISDSLN